MNYFELFNLTPHFDVDLEQLESGYHQLQKRYHPDRVAHHAQHEQLTAARQCALINDAYQILKEPLTRASYLLELAGIPQTSEQTTCKDTEFLMLQMQWQEALEELKNTPAHIPIFAQQIEEHYATQLHLLTAALNKQQWENANEALTKLRFIAKMKIKIEDVQNTFVEF